MDRNNYKEKEYEDDVIDLKVLFVYVWQGLRKFWWCIPIAVITVLAAGYWYKTRQYVPMYESKGIFTVSTKVNEEAGEDAAAYEFFYNKGAASQMAVTFPYIIKSEVFQQVLTDELGTDFINGDISVEAIPDTNLFTMTVTSDSSDDAYEIVQAVMKNYPTIAQYVIGDTKLTILQEPAYPKVPYNAKNPGKSTMLKIALLGFLLGLVPTGLYAMTRKQIHRADEMKECLNLTCLESIHKVSQKKRSKKVHSFLSVRDQKMDGAFVKSMKRLSYKVAKEMESKQEKVVLVTSTNPNEGKSMVSYNLCKEFQEQGKKVVLIHGDVRKASEMNLSPEKNGKADLQSFLKDPAGMVAKMEKTRKDDVLVELGMKDDVEEPISLLQGESMKALMQALRDAGEYIVIDTPPVGLMADAIILSQYADGIVYVVRQDYMNRGQILNAIASLPVEDCRIYGGVLNYSTERKLGEYSYYQGYEFQA